MEAEKFGDDSRLYLFLRQAIRWWSKRPLTIQGLVVSYSPLAPPTTMPITTKTSQLPLPCP